MNIDRHNYEEFFILYWDNELTASQKQAVENFVKENSDLQEELQILGVTRFTPDNNIRFEEKEFLLDDSSINITNYEEQLLNYIDDELAKDERNEVERAAAKYPVIQKELSLLQKAKLQPEQAIVFPDKSILYRREEKVRVISMTWLRVAVAAAIILIVGFTVFQLVNTGKNGNTTGVASVDPPKNNPVINQNVSKDSITKDPEQNIARVDNKLIKDPKKERTDDKKKDKENLITLNTKDKINNKNNLPKPRKDLIANNQDVAKNQIAPETNLPIIKRDIDKTQKTESGGINASFTKTDVTNKPELALYIPEAEEKEKGSLKEFLRKTTRVFERRTKIQTTTEDNKLLVGAFAVSLK